MDKKEGAPRVRFPLAFKLALIISFLILLSLGAITFLVSLMVSGDVRITAEDNNFSVNRRSAAETEIFLNMIRSNSMALLDTMEVLEDIPGGEGAVRQAVDFFFERNPDIAFIGVSGGRDGLSTMLVNEVFFTAAETDSTLAESFVLSRPDAMERCRVGELLILNAAPVFGVPSLAMFCPWQNDGEAEGAIIFFSPDSLSDIFGTGANVSSLVNDDGDILIHADYSLVRGGVNAAEDPFVKMLWESPERNLQTLYASSGGERYFGAFQKLSIANAAVLTTVEYRTVFEGITATTRRNILLTGAVLLIAILFIYFFSKTISRPLRDLTVAAGRIEQGEFEITIESKSRDEVGLLSRSFVSMGRGLAERERLKDTFGRFTNKEIAERALKGELTLGGEAKSVTVFFSDIRSFTAISEKLEPAEVVEFLNEYMTVMVDCVEKTGGVVDKFIGDSVMAVWGAPLSTGSPALDAMNSVRTALMMRSALQEFNKDRGEGKKSIVKIGCGINTGEAIAGQIGSRSRMEYTVIGDAVNLASRTEALNKPFGTDILITENTYNLIGDHLITEEMPLVTVKGKEKPVRIFAVVNLKIQDKEQSGPVTLAELRRLLGIATPDLSKVDTGEEEKKYRIGAT
jgi:adenylate cyclase